MAVRYITLHHYDSTVKTIQEFMEKNRIFGLSPDEFFNENSGYENNFSGLLWTFLRLNLFL